MLVETSDNIDTLYINSLIQVAEEGVKVGGVQDASSPNTQDSFLEHSPAVLILTNPRHRVIKARRFDVFNAIGQFLWILSGSDSQEDVAFYNPVAKFFADDDSGKLYGPWGERISPKIKNIVDMLKKDPSSRRAIIPVFTPKDVGHPSKNLPCCTSLQFFIRNGRLSCNVTMRSSNAFGVLPYDLFMLTMVHEFVASCIPSPLGEFRFIANSFHVYEKDMPRLNKMLEDTRHFSPAKDSFPPMPPMPTTTSSAPDFIKFILNLEKSVRTGMYIDNGNGEKERIDPNKFDIDLYWKDLLLITSARYKKLNESEENYLNKRLEIADQLSYEPLSTLVMKS